MIITIKKNIKKQEINLIFYIPFNQNILKKFYSNLNRKNFLSLLN